MQSDRIVLLVEDERLVAEVFETCLEEAGFAVETARSGKAALAVIERIGGKLSGLITDVRLPGHTCGWEIARKAREVNAALPIIYVTGDSGVEFESESVPNSALLAKPFEPARLVDTLSALSETGEPPDADGLKLVG